MLDSLLRTPPMREKPGLEIVCPLLLAFAAALTKIPCTQGSEKTTADVNCLQFVQYHPSAWEAEWVENRATYSQAICQNMKEAVGRSNVWLEEQSSPSARRPVKPGGLEADALSYFEYRDLCSGPSEFVLVRIWMT